jgi:hypothetical protein
LGIMGKYLGDTFFRAVLDAIPSPIFIVNPDLEVQACNSAAAPLIGKNPSLVLQLRSGEVLHCIHSTDSEHGCGRGEHCKTCILRNSVAESSSGEKVVRRAAKMKLSAADGWSDVYLLVTAAPLTYRGIRYTVLTLENINELIELRKLIPICANCKKIRNEQAFWSTLETYFKHHMDLDFTHSICPDCFEKLYPDLAERRKLHGIGDV